MKSKASKKLAALDLNPKEIMKADNCTKIKGGGYWCCTRNKWIS